MLYSCYMWHGGVDGCIYLVSSETAAEELGLSPSILLAAEETYRTLLEVSDDHCIVGTSY